MQALASTPRTASPGRRVSERPHASQSLQLQELCGIGATILPMRTKDSLAIDGFHPWGQCGRFLLSQATHAPNSQ
jgi:hypothetical protein